MKFTSHLKVLMNLLLCLEVIYYRDFTSYLNCNSLFTPSQYWSIISGSYSSGSGCQYSCTRSDNSNTAYILSPDMSNYPSGLQMTKALTQPYSFYGVDLVYLIKIDNLVMSIYDGNTKIFKQSYSGASKGTKIEYYYQLDCSIWSGNMNVYKETVQINNVLASNTINVQFYQTVTDAYSWYGVLYLRAWANCVENCDLCADNTNCNRCLPGFNRYTLPSGQKVCDQTYNCNLTNCFSCVMSSPNAASATCVRCMPGYILDATSSCVPNTGGSCLTGKYQTGGGCQSYSTNCFMQKQNTNITWVACPGVVSVSSYYCQNTQQILIFEHKNYQLNTCGCIIQYCAVCSTTNSCQQCISGYTFDGLSGTCVFQSCPSFQIQDPYTGSCVSMCSGLNCQECNASTCTVCNPSGNYYIVASSPQNCQLCSIANCTTCTGDGLCSQCNNMYSLSLDKTSCLPCNVSECSQCQVGSSNLCQTCVTGFVLSADTTTCQCGVSNCSVCSNTNGAICNSCVSGYLISGDQTQCSCDVDNCSVCVSTNGLECQTCAFGYILDPFSFQCLCSVNNCNVCNPINGAICNKCANNYSPVNTQTSNCSCQVYGCSQCQPSNGLLCQICYPGYSLDVNGQCQCTLSNCSQCNSSNGNICSSCVTNYTLNPSNSQCQCAVSNCNSCNPTDGSLCLSCVPGYLLSSNSKVCTCGVSNCASCDPSNGQLCQSCISGFTLSADYLTCTCQVSQCATCSPANGLQCQTCVSGYILSANSSNCSCGVQNCANCNLINGSQCQNCVTGYVLSSNKSTCNCGVNNCASCNKQDGQICDNCDTGYAWDQNNNQCVSTQCNVSMCTKCQQFQNNLCSICADQYSLDTNFQCVLSQTNNFSVTSSVIENIGYNVTLNFDENIVIINKNISQILTVSIQNYNNPFQTNFISSLNNTINLQLLLSDNCKDKNLLVQMQDSKFVQVNNLQRQQQQVQLQQFIVQTPEQKQQVQATEQVTQKTASSLLITMILIVILGNTYVLFSTIDYATFIYFLLFINVRYPANMLAFCQIFKNFQFAFIPNVFQVYLMDPNYIQPYTPQVFIDNGYDAYFFNGAGQSLTTILGVLAVYGFLKLLSLTPIPSIKIYVLSKLQSGWEYNGFFDLVGCVYIYILISALLQFYCFQFDESLSFFNYAFFSFFFLGIFVFLIVSTIWISRCKNLSDPKIQQQFGSLIGGLVLPEIETNEEQDEKKKRPSSASKISPNDEEEKSPKGKVGNSPEEEDHQKSKEQKKLPLTRQRQLQLKWSKYTNIICYVRKLLYTMVIIYFFGQVYLQMVLICLMNIYLAHFYFYIRPQEEKSDNIRNGLSEIILIGIQIAVCFLVQDEENQSEQDRYNIGWVIVGGSGLILFIHIIKVVIDLMKATFNLVKDFVCTLIKPKKELEKLKEEKLGQVEQSENKLFAITSQISLDKLRSMNRKFSTVFREDSPIKFQRTMKRNNCRSLVLNSVVHTQLNSTMNNIELQLQQDHHDVRDIENRNDNNNENCLKLDIHDHQEQEHGNDCKSISPSSKYSGNSQKNIEQVGLLNNNNITINQIVTSRPFLGEVPQSLNVSFSDHIKS